MDFPPRKGFSLIEVLIGLVIMGVLVSLGAPAFRDLLMDLRVRSAATGFERVLRHARREAITHRRTVRICPSGNGVNCDPRQPWENGWISYTDRQGGPDRDELDPLLRVFGPRRDLAIHFNGGDRISINALGRISRNASLDFCAENLSHPGIRLVMIHSGRLRMVDPSPVCGTL